MRNERGRLVFLSLAVGYAVLAAACVVTLAARDDLDLGRAPWENLVRTLGDFSRPSFLDAWFWNPRLEYRSQGGELLRVEDRRAVERSYLVGLATSLAYGPPCCRRPCPRTCTSGSSTSATPRCWA